MTPRRPPPIDSLHGSAPRPRTAAARLGSTMSAPNSISVSPYAFARSPSVSTAAVDAEDGGVVRVRLVEASCSEAAIWEATDDAPSATGNWKRGPSCTAPSATEGCSGVLEQHQPSKSLEHRARVIGSRTRIKRHRRRLSSGRRSSSPKRKHLHDKHTLSGSTGEAFGYRSSDMELVYFQQAQVKPYSVLNQRQYQDPSTLMPIIAMHLATACSLEVPPRLMGIMMSSRWVNTPELHQPLL